MKNSRVWPLFAILALAHASVVAIAQVVAPLPPTNLTVDGLPPNPPGLPPGVTLRSIDGGPTYYADHGFTYAVNRGWDNPSFFPVGLWLAPMHSQADLNRWLDLSLNFAHGLTANSNLSYLRNNGISLIFQGDADERAELLGNNGGSFGNELVGLIAYDEPNTLQDAYHNIDTTPNSIQNNRFWYETYTHNQYRYGDVGGVAMATLLSALRTTPNGTGRHIDITGTDVYWMAGGLDPGWWSRMSGVYHLPSATFNADLARRPIHYGQTIDMSRAWQASNFPAPIVQFIENGGPYTENTSAAHYITPPEMNASVWASIMHGARIITYFNHSFAGPAQSADNFSMSFYRTVQPGQSISIYDQAKATNALIRTLATVLNSPFAEGYVTVSPAPTGITDFTGGDFDVAAKYHNVAGGDNRFYIFAMPRWSPTMSNQIATFTIKNTGATQVTVVNESRTIPVTNGGTQFVDNFATSNTVHIYRVD